MKKLIFLLIAMAHLFWAPSTNAVPPIKVGLNADMSNFGRMAGVSIQRGAEIAINQINQAGGVLGRELYLDIRDHTNDPSLAAVNIDEFGQDPDIAAVLGGLNTRIIIHELQRVHGHGVPYLIPWAAGTKLVSNEFEPNFVFRLSVRDEWAGEFLIESALEEGFKKFGLALVRDAWGRSNQMAMTKALAAKGMSPVGIEWVLSADDEFGPQLNRLIDAGADIVILVGSAPFSLPVVRAMASLESEKRTAIVSHWGITSGNFVENIGEQLSQVQLCFLQTYSFFDPKNSDLNTQFLQDYNHLYSAPAKASAIFSPVGAAHAYDLIHLLAKAIEAAGSIDRLKIRQEMKKIEHYEGLVKTYNGPFAGGLHEALDANDYRFARFDQEGQILPATLNSCSAN